MIYHLSSTQVSATLVFNLLSQLKQIFLDAKYTM